MTHLCDLPERRSGKKASPHTLCSSKIPSVATSLTPAIINEPRKSIQSMRAQLAVDSAGAKGKFANAQLQRVRHFIRGNIIPSPKVDISTLRSFLARMHDADSYTYHYLDFSTNAGGEEQYRRVFIAEGFQRRLVEADGALMIFSVDAAFMKAGPETTGTLLTLHLIPATRELLFAAYAHTVENESSDTWQWFFWHVAQAFPRLQLESWHLISDQDKGLASITTLHTNTEDPILPFLYHAKCAYHRAEKQKADYRPVVKALACAPNLDEFNALWKRMSPPANSTPQVEQEYLAQQRIFLSVPPNRFCLAHMPLTPAEVFVHFRECPLKECEFSMLHAPAAVLNDLQAAERYLVALQQGPLPQPWGHVSSQIAESGNSQMGSAVAARDKEGLFGISGEARSLPVVRALEAIRGISLKRHDSSLNHLKQPAFSTLPQQAYEQLRKQVSRGRPQSGASSAPAQRETNGFDLATYGPAQASIVGDLPSLTVKNVDGSKATGEVRMSVNSPSFVAVSLHPAERCCSCRMFQLFGVPCVHALTLAAFFRQQGMTCDDLSLFHPSWHTKNILRALGVSTPVPPCPRLV